MLNATINGYTIQHLIGEGGMAQVYFATNRLGKSCAIKVLKRKFSDDGNIRLRFENEARIMLDLEHPNIRGVYDLAEVDGQPMMLMEYLDGKTLKEELSDRKNIPDTVLKEWFVTVAKAIAYAHSKGVVHRDIKPSNLFLTTDGKIKLLDFGIAKLKDSMTATITGQTLGTVMYMSPEQIHDPKRVDLSTDIYSLGVTFHHLLSGRPPYDTNTSSQWQIQTRIVQEPLPLDHLADHWKRVLGICLEKEPEKRNLQQALEAFHLSSAEDTVVESSEKEPEPLKEQVTRPQEMKEPVEELRVEVVAKEPDSVPKERSRFTPLRIMFIVVPLVVIAAVVTYMLRDKGSSAQQAAVDPQKWMHLEMFFTDSAGVGYRDTVLDKVVLPPIYSAGGHYFWHGVTCVRIADNPGQWVLIDSDGNHVSEIFDEMIAWPSEDRAVFSVARFMEDGNPRWGLIDAQGKELVPLKYGQISCETEGMNCIGPFFALDPIGRRNWCLLGKSFEELTGFEFSDYGYLANGVMPAEKGGRYVDNGRIFGKWGFIDARTGRTRIPFSYDDAYPFMHGWACVKKGESWSLIDINGEASDLGSHEELKPYRNWCALRYKNGGRYGVKGYNNEVKVAFGWDELEYEDHEPYLNSVMVRSAAQCGFLDTLGNWIVPLAPGTCGFETPYVYRISANGKRKDYFELDGKFYYGKNLSTDEIYHEPSN